MRPYEGKLPPDDEQRTMPAKDYVAYRDGRLDRSTPRTRSTPEHTDAWRRSPLEDQQLGGQILWVPSGLVFLGGSGCGCSRDGFGNRSAAFNFPRQLPSRATKPLFVRSRG